MNRMMVSMVMCTMTGFVFAQAPAGSSTGGRQASSAGGETGVVTAPPTGAVTMPPKDPATAVRDITQALRGEAEVPASALSVAVHADAVVLSGEVTTEAQAARALSIAQQHAGGVRVSSHVEVREAAGAASLSSGAQNLVREVERALKQDRRTANLGVAVSVDEQQVIGLHGLVPSRESRAAAEEVAARVTGVKSVSSHLVVPAE